MDSLEEMKIRSDATCSPCPKDVPPRPITNPPRDSDPKMGINLKCVRTGG